MGTIDFLYWLLYGATSLAIDHGHIALFVSQHTNPRRKLYI
jgi:hypothetical protein